MVESMANSVEDYLIEGLNFKMSPGASYVTDRKVQFSMQLDLKPTQQDKVQG